MRQHIDEVGDGFPESQPQGCLQHLQDGVDVLVVVLVLDGEVFELRDELLDECHDPLQVAILGLQFILCMRPQDIILLLDGVPFSYTRQTTNWCIKLAIDVGEM